MFSTVVCLLLTALIIVNGHYHHRSQIHKRMTNEDLVKIFKVSHPDLVPEYDIAHIRSIQKRDTSGDKLLHFTAFGQKIKLNLKRNKELHENIRKVKVFSAKSSSSGQVDLEEDFKSELDEDEIGVPYQDALNKAALVLRHDQDENLHVDGMLGENLVVQPMPFSMLEDMEKYNLYEESSEDETDDEYADDEMFLDDDDNEVPSKSHKRYNNVNEKFGAISDDVPKTISTPGGVHIVYKINSSSSDDHTDYMFMEPSDGESIDKGFPQVRSNSTNEEAHIRRKRATFGPIYPEILAIVDYESYIMHAKDNREIKKYMISFWNGVDMRYRLLSSPKIRISLAGIIISKDSNANPYLERNRLSRTNKDAVDATGALTDLGRYLYRERRLPVYDAAVVLTKLDMCRKRYSSGRCNRGTAGFAYVGGACVVNKRLEKVNSVAIIEDTGGFSGIIVAAHEVGHLLGCVHDGSPAPSYLGGPGAKHCLWEDGYIMSDLRHTERGFRWSTCSTQQFKHFLNGETADCLFNYPSQSQNLDRILPGKLLSLDAQCKRDRGTSACFKDSRVCAQLFCFDSSSGYCVSYRPAAEGSPCGNGQHCRNGVCVPDNDNVIPDYSQQTATYVSNDKVDHTLEPVQTKTVPTKPATTKFKTTKRLSYRNRKFNRRTTQKPNVPTYKRQLNYRKNNNGNYQRIKFGHKTTGKNENASDAPVVSNAKESSCVDKVTSVGGYTCTTFLERFSTHHCDSLYIKLNCCASRRKMCSEVTSNDN